MIQGVYSLKRVFLGECFIKRFSLCVSKSRPWIVKHLGESCSATSNSSFETAEVSLGRQAFCGEEVQVVL
jgi:hypothetical protein